MLRLNKKILISQKFQKIVNKYRLETMNIKTNSNTDFNITENEKTENTPNERS